MTESEFLIDCCMRGFNNNSEVDQPWDNHNCNLILIIELDIVALKQSELPGHGHYTLLSYRLGYNLLGYQTQRP